MDGIKRKAARSLVAIATTILLSSKEAEKNGLLIADLAKVRDGLKGSL